MDVTEVPHLVGAKYSAEEVIANTQALIPRLRERFLITEELRQLPEETVQDAADAGIFSVLLPRSLGGSAGGIRDQVEIMRLLAQGDPSAAWTLGFFMTHNFLLARFGAEVQAEVFVDGKPSLMAGVANPPGRAEPVDGGYLITGYWSYCSGVMHADWVLVTATIDGQLSPWVFLVPRDEVEVPDTWFMAGMKGTGSHDVKLDQHFVPGHRGVDFIGHLSRHNPGAAIHPEPLYAYDARDLTEVIGPSIIVGAAEAVLEGYRDRLDKRRAPFSPTLAGDTVFGQMRYARAVRAVRAAKVLLDSVVLTTVEANGATDDDIGFEPRARLKLDCLSVVRFAREAIEVCLDGSGSSIFKTSDITQHYLRDVQTLFDHLTLDEDAMLAKAGEIMLGRSVEPNPTLMFI